MAKVFTALYAVETTVQNVVDDLVNIGLPTEKILADEEGKTVKIIVGVAVEKEIEEVLKRHKPEEVSMHSLKEKKVAETLTATYEAADTLQNVVDDLINIGLPAEEIFADKERKTVKVIVPKVIEAEIREVLKRHDPIRVE
ncbi:MAG TPA: hypothetical protein ENI88_04130 [Desulfobulbus sp.]|nr:hypothetical protein [Desulfobulbus sp.]